MYLLLQVLLHQSRSFLSSCFPFFSRDYLGLVVQAVELCDSGVIGSTPLYQQLPLGLRRPQLGHICTSFVNVALLIVIYVCAGNETFEKLGTIGTSHNLLVYLTQVFNMKRMTATNVLNIFNGSANLATLVGAYLCDTYFGRYKTLGFASIASFLVNLRFISDLYQLFLIFQYVTS